MTQLRDPIGCILTGTLCVFAGCAAPTIEDGATPIDSIESAIIVLQEAPARHRVAAYKFLAARSDEISPQQGSGLRAIAARDLLSEDQHTRAYTAHLLTSTPYIDTPGAARTDWQKLLANVTASRDSLLLSRVGDLVLHQCPSSQHGRDALLRLATHESVDIAMPAAMALPMIPVQAADKAWILAAMPTSVVRLRPGLLGLFLRASEYEMSPQDAEKLVRGTETWSDADRAIVFENLIFAETLPPGVTKALQAFAAKAEVAFWGQAMQPLCLHQPNEVSKAQLERLKKLLRSEDVGRREAALLAVLFFNVATLKWAEATDYIEAIQDDDPDGASLRMLSALAKTHGMPPGLQADTAESIAQHLLETDPLGPLPYSVFARQAQALRGWGENFQELELELLESVRIHTHGWALCEQRATGLRQILEASKQREHP